MNADTPAIDDPDAAFAAAQAHLEAGETDAAAALCRALVAADDSHARAWHLWGFVTLQTGDVAGALERLEQSVERGNPNPSLYMHLGLARAMAGQTPGAIAALEAAVAGEPRLMPAQFNLGLAYKQAGRLADAAGAFTRAVELDPAHATAWAELAGVYMTRNQPGDQARAADALDRALAADPDHVGALNQQALLLQHQGHDARARALLTRAAELAPDQAEVRTNLGNALLGVDGPGAIEAFAHVVAVRPDFPGARARLAMAHEHMGAVDAARTHAHAALAEGESALARLTLARCALRDGDLDDALAELDALDPATCTPRDAINGESLRATVLDRRGDAPGAWAAATRANRLEIDQRPPDAERREDMYEAIRTDRLWFTPARVAAWPRDVGADTAAPVFFVGFPRSGTTVMEQVLRAHPDLVAGGENTWLFATVGGAPQPYPARLADLNGAEIARLRRAYWARVAATLGQDVGEELARPGAPRRLIDKMPLNALHLGFVRRVFPDAKVLVALRDPRDCVLSAYMQNFHRTVFMDQFLTLHGAARFYGAVMGLWRHFDAALGLDSRTYRYEDLVADPRATLVGVLDFLGVAWDDRVLAHAEHTRGTTIATPSLRDAGAALHTRAAKRWPAYADELAPAMGLLAPFIEKLGYGDA